MDVKASVSISSGLIMWWPRTVPNWVKSGNYELLLRRACIGCAGSCNTWTVRGHHIHTPDDIETDAIAATFPHAPDRQLL